MGRIIFYFVSYLPASFSIIDFKEGGVFIHGKLESGLDFAIYFPIRQTVTVRAVKQQKSI